MFPKLGYLPPSRLLTCFFGSLGGFDWFVLGVSFRGCASLKSFPVSLGPQTRLFSAARHPDADSCFNLRSETVRTKDLGGLGGSSRVESFKLSHILTLAIQSFQIPGVFFFTLANPLRLCFKGFLDSFGGFLSLLGEAFQVFNQCCLLASRPFRFLQGTLEVLPVGSIGLSEGLEQFDLSRAKLKTLCRDQFSLLLGLPGLYSSDRPIPCGEPDGRVLL